MIQLNAVPNYKPEEVKGFIHDAEAMLTEGGYTDDERIALLPTIIGLLASRTVVQQHQERVAVDLPGLRGRLPA